MVPGPKVQLSNSEPDGSAAPKANSTYDPGPDEVAGPGSTSSGPRSVRGSEGPVIKAGPSSVAGGAEGPAGGTKLSSSLGAVKVELAGELELDGPWD